MSLLEVARRAGWKGTSAPAAEEASTGVSVGSAAVRRPRRADWTGTSR